MDDEFAAEKQRLESCIKEKDTCIYELTDQLKERDEELKKTRNLIILLIAYFSMKFSVYFRRNFYMLDFIKLNTFNFEKNIK